MKIFLSPRPSWLLDLPKNEKGYRDCRDITETHLLHHNHLVVIECIKSGCARDKVLRFRDQQRPEDKSDAHRKSIVRNWDRPRSVVGSDRCGTCRVRSFRPTNTTILLSLSPSFKLEVYFTTQSFAFGVYPTSSDITRSFLPRFRSL